MPPLRSLCEKVEGASAERTAATSFERSFVPLDGDGNAIRARIWRPVSTEDICLEQHALHLIGLRANVDR